MFRSRFFLARFFNARFWRQTLPGPPSTLVCHSWLTAAHGLIANSDIEVMQWCRIPLYVGSESSAAIGARIAAENTSPYLFVSDTLGDLGPGTHSVYDQPIADVVRDGYDMTYIAPRAQAMFEAIRDAGVTPQKIIIDEELFHDYFDLMDGLDDAGRVALMTTFYDDPTTYANMTPAMQAHDAAYFGPWRQGFYDFRFWINSYRIDALRQIRDLARTCWSDASLVATNWEDRGTQGFASTDLNGTIFNAQSVTELWSAPSAYADVGTITTGLTKHVLWNALINTLNSIRSIDLTRATIWISYASYHTGVVASDSFVTWLWGQMVRLIIEAGATDLIFWNPSPATDAENDLMESILTEYAGQSFTPISGSSAIALDADSITMGPRTLLYSTFLAYLNPVPSSTTRRRRRTLVGYV
jgi:hypothetical protein